MITELLKELGKLHFKDFTTVDLVNEWKAFFEAGNVSEYYLHTLSEILIAGLRAQKEKKEVDSAILSHLTKKEI